MTPDWITSTATVFTALVIGASAIAALLQLRHMRKSNEIEVIAKWTETIESAQFQEARSFVLGRLPLILSDRARVAALSWNPIPPEIAAPVRTVCNHFESVGAFVKMGSVDARIACELWALVVLDCWRAVAPVAQLIREQYGSDGVWENFEYLAVLSEQWQTDHGGSTYPPGVRCMPPDRSLTRDLQAMDESG